MKKRSEGTPKFHCSGPNFSFCLIHWRGGDWWKTNNKFEICRWHNITCQYIRKNPEICRRFGIRKCTLQHVYCNVVFRFWKRFKSVKHIIYSIQLQSTWRLRLEWTDSNRQSDPQQRLTYSFIVLLYDVRLAHSLTSQWRNFYEAQSNSFDIATSHATISMQGKLMDRLLLQRRQQ